MGIIHNYQTAHGTWTWDSTWPGLANAAAEGIALGRTMAVTWSDKRQELYVFHEGDPAILVFQADGTFVRGIGGHWPMAHGMFLDETSGDTPRLWLTNRRPNRVECWSVDGEQLLVLARPNHPAYADPDAPYEPSDVVVWNDRVWVTDGYCQQWLHRYTLDGAYIDSVDGAHPDLGGLGGAHGMRVDRRSGEELLAITDRGNRRIRWLNTDGAVVRWLDHATHSPSAFAFDGDLMLVTEMFTGVKILNKDGHVVIDAGPNPAVLADKGVAIPAVAATAPRCDFPHGCCEGRTGEFWFTEGVDGGRIIRLYRSA